MFLDKGVLFKDILDSRLQPYGLRKYLTYNCLLMQFASSVLHLLTGIFPKLKKVRDIVFTTLAYPIGAFVVCKFWTIWWTQGREQIYPVAIETYYPVWLNHVTHTMVLPINIGQAYLTNHLYMNRGSIITVLFILAYTIYVLFIRFNCGAFVYPYLNRMGKVSLAIYTVSNAFLILVAYESGSFTTTTFHPKKLRRHTN